MADRRKHLNDRECIAWLDGELPARSRSTAAAHLDACWQCRSRASALQRQMDAVAQAYRAVPPLASPPPGLFGNWEQRYQEINKPPAPLWRTRRFVLPVVAAASLTLVAATSTLLLRPDKPLRSAPVDSAAWMARQDAIEDALDATQTRQAKAARQQFTLRVERLAPQRASRQVKLTVWSDAAGARQSWRVESESGQLHFARWNGGGATPEEQNSLGKSAGSRPGSLESLEAQAVDLVRRQPAKRLRLASGMFRTLCRNGFTIEPAAQQSDAFSRITARRRNPKMTESAWLDFDRHSGKPLSLGLSAEGSAASWQIVFRLQEDVFVNASEVPPGTFSPPAMERTSLPARRAAPPPPVIADPVELEGRILAFLVDWRAEGERLHIGQVPGENVAVTGQLLSAERRRELAAALNTWPGVSFRLSELPAASGSAGWCAKALTKSGESLQLADFLSELDRLSQATTVPERLRGDLETRYAAQLASLDQLVRPFRGSDGAAVAVVRSRQAAAESLVHLIEAACAGWHDDSAPSLDTAARQQLVGVVLAAQSFIDDRFKTGATPQGGNQP